MTNHSMNFTFGVLVGVLLYYGFILVWRLYSKSFEKKKWRKKSNATFEKLMMKNEEVKNLSKVKNERENY